MPVLDARMRGLDGGSALAFEIAETGARYPLTIDPTITQQGFFRGSNTEGGDLFGFSVAVDGDTAVVGAIFEDGGGRGVDPSDNNSALNAGAAYVFVRNNGVWSQQAPLKASNTGDGDSFGSAVAVSGDTVVVGASTEDGGGRGVGPADSDSVSNAGAAYVFVRDGSGMWSQQAYLKASNTGSNPAEPTSGGDRFGTAVAISANTIVVGAPEEDGGSSGIDPSDNDSSQNAGSAYVFVRNGMIWSQQAQLKASNADRNDQFGFSVAASGETVVVGSRQESGSGSGANPPVNDDAPGAGAAYVFVRSGNGWSQQAYLKASNSQDFDRFGSSVGLSGNTLVVGAINEDGGGTGVNPLVNESADNAGAAYVFERLGSGWSQQALLKASNTGSGDFFGSSVSVSGDTVVVGANGEYGGGSGVDPASNDSARLAGAAYTYVRSGSTWSPLSYLKASNNGAFYEFGLSVSVSGDTVIVGAPREGFGGAAYVFTLSNPEPDPPLSPPQFSIAENGDVTVTVSGADPTRSYVLQRSIELEEWMTISDVLSGSSLLVAIDSDQDSTRPAAFYRFAVVTGP